MKVLVIGGGGREHALVWKLKQSPLVEKIFCIPGNAGIAELAECQEIPLNDFESIASFVREMGVDFTVVGPEQPLVEGMVDYFTSKGLKIFGPNRLAAQMEGSKVFAKRLMQKYQIPTAQFATFQDVDEAIRYLQSIPDGPVVVKADGLAAGKGSIVCQNREMARQALQDMMVRRVFADAGRQVVIEEFMEGEEASLFVLTDGKDYQVLAPAQDFKRALDNDEGKNTGGMGSYAPARVVTREVFQQAISQIVEPTLEALRKEGISYKGVLYCGLMLTREGPRVVEFNCRFGDPETQVVLPLLENDLMELLLAVEEGKLASISVSQKPGYAVCVVVASGGYPDAYEKGKVITGLENLPEDILVFHAGTRRTEKGLVTNGGRVLGVTAMAAELKEAIEKVYQAVGQIHFQGMHFRRDIARRALNLPEPDTIAK